MNKSKFEIGDYFHIISLTATYYSFSESKEKLITFEKDKMNYGNILDKYFINNKWFYQIDSFQSKYKFINGNCLLTKQEYEDWQKEESKYIKVVWNKKESELNKIRIEIAKMCPESNDSLLDPLRPYIKVTYNIYTKDYMNQIIYY